MKMKIKKLLAVLFAVSITACLPGCDNEESSEVIDEKQQIANQIAENYDNKHPEETVIAILKNSISLMTSFESRIDYDESNSTYTVEVWTDGLAEQLTGSKEKSAETRKNFEELWKTQLQQIRLIDPGANILFSLLDDKDQKTPLLTIENGVTISDSISE